MSGEIKTSKTRVIFHTSDSLKAKFARHCKKMNVSVSQRMRDLMQKDLKEVKTDKKGTGALADG